MSNYEASTSNLLAYTMLKKNKVKQCLSAILGIALWEQYLGRGVAGITKKARTLGHKVWALVYIEKLQQWLYFWL